MTPWTAARQVTLSVGFSRQEYWSGLPVPSPQDLPNPGLLHCRQIVFHLSYREDLSQGESESEVAQSCPTLCDPMDCVAYQAPPSMGFSRQEYWSGLPLPSPLPHCRPVLYCLSHNRPGLLEAFILYSRRWRYKSSLRLHFCPPFAVCFLSKLPVPWMPLSQWHWGCTQELTAGWGEVWG